MKKLKSETIQIGDYESLRKECSVFFIIMLIVIAVSFSITNSLVGHLVRLVLIAVIILGILLFTRGKLRERYNHTARIRYENDSFQIGFANTKYIIKYDEIASLEYIPKLKAQKQKQSIKDAVDDTKVNTFVNRYELVFTFKDSKTLRLSTPIGRYYPDFKNSGFGNLYLACKNMNAFPKDDSYAYHDVICPLPNTKAFYGKAEPNGQIFDIQNMRFVFEQTSLIIKNIATDEQIFDHKYLDMKNTYIFVKYAAKKSDGKHICLRFVYKNGTYRDFLLSRHDYDEELNSKVCDTECRVAIVINAVIERMSL